MRRLIALMVDYPLVPRLLNIAVILIGIACLSQIRRDVFPSASYETLTINTEFPGASAEEVETLVTNGLELRVREANGIRKLTSRSVEGKSVIVAQLDSSATTEAKALAEVRNAVERFQSDLPGGSEKPVVVADDTSQQALIEIHLVGESLLELERSARKLKRELELVPGVARVTPVGLPDVEFRVETSAAALARHQITLLDIATALKRRNLSVPGGTIEAKASAPEVTVRTSGRITSIGDISATIVRANEAGSKVAISDLATVRETLARPTMLVKTGGKRAVSLVVLKREKADAVTLVETLRQRTEGLLPSLGRGVSLEYINDLSQFITRKLSILTSNFTTGLMLLVIMLAFFLPLRLAAIVSLGLPFAIFGTLAIYYWADYTLNLVSLMGLIIIAGMLIDDAVVVADSCLRELTKHGVPRDAAVEGTVGVWRSAAASSFVTMIAFAPVLFMGGQMGTFVRQLPLAVVLALCLSLLRSFFILPGDFRAWIRMGATEKNSPVDRLWEGAIVPAYLATLAVVLKHRGKALALTAILFVATLMYSFLAMPFVPFPSNDMELFVIQAKTPPGSSLETTELAVAPIEKALASLPKAELKQFVTTSGHHTTEGLIPHYGAELAETFVYLTPPETRARTNEAIIEHLTREIGHPAGLDSVRFVRVGPVLSSGKPVQVGILVKEYEQAIPLVRELETKLHAIRGVGDIFSTYQLDTQRLSLDVSPLLAASAGVSVEEIGNTVRGAYHGITPTKVWREGTEAQVRVTLEGTDRAEAATLQRLNVSAPSGALVPISRLGRLVSSRELKTRDHEDGRRQIVIAADIDPALTDALTVSRELAPTLRKLGMAHPEAGLVLGGDTAAADEGFSALLLTFACSMLVMFLILVLTYQRMSHALLTFISIPLGFMAATWAFALHGKPYTFLGVMGIIALCGVIVNNAVIYLDFINQFRAEGQDRWQSLISTGQRRLRPIFLTTATTVAGVLPTAYGIGGADSFVTYIALALSWGLGLGAVLNLFVLPAGVALLDDILAASFFSWRELAVWRRYRPQGAP